MTFSSPWASIPAAFASLGIAATIFVFLVFIKFDSTPIIMASGRELCYVLQCGLIMCYLMTFVMVWEPTVVSCTLLRIGLGLSLSVCYSALFTKTNRISRIFNRGIKAMVKRPSYTSPKSQLVICLCLISVQLIGAVTWLGMDFPDTVTVYPDRRNVVRRCKSTNVAIVMSLLYNMVLIILCTVYAFKTRKIPENFNEAKYIAFTMYSTCIVWLAFVPIYFGTKSDFKIQITSLCMCVSISATVALFCLFLPKVYIVLFQPHKNVRQATAASQRMLFRQSSKMAAGVNGGITSPSTFVQNNSSQTCMNEEKKIEEDDEVEEVEEEEEYEDEDEEEEEEVGEEDEDEVDEGEEIENDDDSFGTENYNEKLENNRKMLDRVKGLEEKIYISPPSLSNETNEFFTNFTKSFHGPDERLV
ncbi:DgyrCDS10732 [Dimorphilus gyrociliatus]|uniref:DgyrCDS10732 n=1 Tax=Dimorphilus gyrociliatus TaxID=2664684 RepID=A0A7I8W270_9ANNE|nr:DgyrCDS10732 [Dimorphilus gyrociliatus]